MKKEVRERTLKEIGASASGILLNEQSTPRHKDLEAGTWIEAVRRADSKWRSAAIPQTKVIHQISTGRRVWVIGEAGNRERVRNPRQPPVGWMPNSPLVRLVFTHFTTGRWIGLSLITTRSRVRIQPPAPDAGVAQWLEHVIPSSLLIRRFLSMGRSSWVIVG